MFNFFRKKEEKDERPYPPKHAVSEHYPSGKYDTGKGSILSKEGQSPRDKTHIFENNSGYTGGNS